MSATMKVEFINPFIASTVKVFDTMLSTQIQRGKIYLHRPDHTHEGVTGVIGLSGDAIGTVAISLSGETARRACERFLGTTCDTVNEDVIDCVGEIVNMISGSAKAQFEDYCLSISLPSIAYGLDHNIQFPKEVTPVCVPFTSDIGAMLLQVGFVLG
jgi:chemotaxis protein CheX